MKKVLIVLFIIIIPSLLLTGCWDLTEPESVGLITVLGVNALENNQIEIIVQDQTLTPGGQQIQKSNWTFDIHKSTGSTVYDAMQNISRNNPEKIYLSHIKAIIISEELVSKQGIKPAIDFFERNPEIRKNTFFLISKKGEFEKIFLPNAKLNIDTGKMIEKVIQNRNTDSFLIDSKLKDFLELYWETYCTPFALGICSTKTFVDNKTIDQGYDYMNIDTYDIDVGDIAVFKDDKIAGWLVGDEGRGFVWVKGKVEGGSVNLNYEGKKITLKVFHMKSKVKPQIVDDKMKINITIDVKSDVGESAADVDFKDKDTIDKVNRVFKDQITKEIRGAINSSKKLSTDIFGLGNYFFNEYPNYWKKVSANWAQYYQKLDINITVNSSIEHIGISKKTARTDK